MLFQFSLFSAASAAAFTSSQNPAPLPCGIIAGPVRAEKTGTPVCVWVEKVGAFSAPAVWVVSAGFLPFDFVVFRLLRACCSF